MGLKIDQRTEDALIFRIAEGLNTVQFFFGLYGSDFSWADPLESDLPDNISDRLTKICGENGLREFIYGQIERKLEENESYPSNDIDKLTEYDEFSDSISSSKTIVEELKSLPYSYRIAARLPDFFSVNYRDICDKFELGPGIFIVSGKQIAADTPSTTGAPSRDTRIAHAAGSARNLTISPDELYLIQNRSGYVGAQKEPPPLFDFKTTLRQFLGSALAVKALKTGGWRRENFDAAYIVHRLDGGASLISAERFAPSLRTLYDTMSNHGNFLASFDPDFSGKSAKLERLNTIKSVFKLNDHGRRLSVAAIWFLRSHMSGDTLDALLESTIALEALLGGANSEGTKLSSLLGNRCAYLIGKSLSDRQEILTKFTEIYTLRSKIVHEGHHRFTSTERKLLVYSQELCRKALVKEMILSNCENS